MLVKQVWPFATGHLEEVQNAGLELKGKKRQSAREVWHGRDGTGLESALQGGG